MVEALAALSGGFHRDFQSFFGFGLAAEVTEQGWAEGHLQHNVWFGEGGSGGGAIHVGSRMGKGGVSGKRKGVSETREAEGAEGWGVIWWDSGDLEV